MEPLPSSLVARVAKARRVVEVGAGARFETALAVAALGPEVLVTDVDARVLAAPAPLRALVHDVVRGDPRLLGPADVVLAVRAPEELQLPIARVARRLGADLALRPLKDEWADVSEAFPRWEALGAGWRWHARPSSDGREW